MQDKALYMTKKVGEGWSEPERITEGENEGKHLETITIGQSLCLAYYDDNNKTIDYGWLNLDDDKRIEFHASLEADRLKIIPDVLLKEDQLATIECSRDGKTWKSVHTFKRGYDSVQRVPYQTQWKDNFYVRIVVRENDDHWISATQTLHIQKPLERLAIYKNEIKSRILSLTVYNRMAQKASIMLYDESHDLVYLQQYKKGKMPRQLHRNIPLESGKLFYLTYILGDEIYFDEIIVKDDSDTTLEITASVKNP